MKAVSFRSLPVLVIMLSLGLVVSPLWAAESVVDFNALSLGALDGQDGWQSVTYACGTCPVQIVDGTSTGSDGSRYVQFDHGGGGVGADGWRLDAFTPFEGTETTAYVQADVSHRVSWGVTFGPAYDTDGDGVQKDESATDLGARLTVKWGDTDNVVLLLPDGTSHAGTSDRASSTWGT